MDADDISLPNRCHLQLEEFKKDPTLSLVSGTIAEFINKPKNIVGRRELPLENSDINLYIKKRCPFNHMVVMFRKSKVLEAGNYQDWHYNEDYYLWIRMYKSHSNFKNLSDDLAFVRVGSDMYRRRGGYTYFKSEFDLQYYMLSNKIITRRLFYYNVTLRFVFQVILPNNIRGIIYRKFARN